MEEVEGFNRLYGYLYIRTLWFLCREVKVFVPGEEKKKKLVLLDDHKREDG